MKGKQTPQTLNTTESVDIVSELQHSYLEYAMNVITDRAIPDIRDGMKPVQRRILYAMCVLNNDFDKAYKKSARVVGDVIGKYHPHGDSAVYEAIVRMAQPFSLRYPLVDGQGNFGSVDGDAAAAMRYTEIRMSRLAHELLQDLSPRTVDWVDNYDGSEVIPKVLPTRIPNLLINGTSGIAVGMATNIPPHNLDEVIDACQAYLLNPYITDAELCQYIKGPDFPTGCEIHGTKGIYDAYTTGRGRIVQRGKYKFEKGSHGSTNIVFTEIPYQVNKAVVIQRIATLVRDKIIDGISHVNDESDKEGMRIVITVRRDTDPEVIVNKLFHNTQLQNAFNVNMVCIVNGKPELVTISRCISEFIRHRYETVIRRTQEQLEQALHRGHILEGLAVALTNVDAIVETIKKSPSTAEAKIALLSGQWKNQGVLKLIGKGQTTINWNGMSHGVSGKVYQLSELQVDEILRLRLSRLTGLEINKLLEEYTAILTTINGYQLLLREPEAQRNLISAELNATRIRSPRRTAILQRELGEFNAEEFINEEQVVVTISHVGYTKIQPVSEYNAQNRGGKGKSATNMREDDYIEHVSVTSNKSTLLIFTNRGRVYWKRVFELPSGSRGAKGKPIVNILPFSNGEKVTAILDVEKYAKNLYVLMATKFGMIKRISLEEFSRPRANGIAAIGLNKGDSLIGAELTNGKQEIMLFNNIGKVIRFKEKEVRSMGRTAKGVRGMSVTMSPVVEDDIKLDLEDDDNDNRETYVTTLIVAPASGNVLLVCENGYGKATNNSDFTTKRRGGKGMIAIKTTERNGGLVGALPLDNNTELLMASNNGIVIRLNSSDIKVSGRNTQGVTLMNLSNGDKIVAVAAIKQPVDTELEEVKRAIKPVNKPLVVKKTTRKTPV